MSEFRFGDHVEVVEGCIEAAFDNAPRPLTYRGESTDSPAFCRVESANGVYHFIPTAWLTHVPTITPAEQAVYDRIEIVLDALADAYNDRIHDPNISRLIRNRAHLMLPAFAALLEAEFTEEA